MQKIPEDIKTKLAQFQTLQQQLQMVAVQKQQLIMDKGEAEDAKKALLVSTGDVYKSVGPLLLKSDKASLEAELSDGIISAENRISLLDKQEQKLVGKAQELQKDLQAGLSGYSG